MTPEQIAAVERTVVAAAPMRDAVAADFYRRLFAAGPRTEAMFSTEPARQREKSSPSWKTSCWRFATASCSCGGPGRWAPGMRSTGSGRRHYRLVGVALLGALAAGLGPAWTCEVDTAWRLAYNLTAEAMMAGAADAVQAY